MRLVSSLLLLVVYVSVMAHAAISAAEHRGPRGGHSLQCRIAMNTDVASSLASSPVMASVKASSAGSCCRKCETNAQCIAATFDRAGRVCHMRSSLPSKAALIASATVDLIVTLRVPLPAELGHLERKGASSVAALPQVQCGTAGTCASGWLCCGSTNGAQQCYDPEFQQCCAAEVSFVCGLSQECCVQSGTGGVGSCCAPGLCLQVSGTCARPTTPAPTIPPCGSPQGGTACPGNQVCCGYYANAVCYDPNTQQCCQPQGVPVLCAVSNTCCTQSGTTSTTCCSNGQQCNILQGQCFVPTTTPAPPMCGSSYCALGASCCGAGTAAVCYDSTSYTCCSNNIGLVCSQKYLQSCCVSENGLYGSCCSSGSLCNSTSGGCFVPPQSTAAPPPTGPPCGNNYCAANMQCCGQVCYDPSVNSCCAASANVVCNAQQTCCASANRPDQGACCSSGYVCNTDAVTCYLPTSQAPAPTGPACGLGNCAPDRQCCGNNTCYNAANAQCCAGGGNVCAGWATCCYSSATGNSGCCSEGQVCDTTSGMCHNTAAPTTGVPCGNSVCSITMQCCGQICYDPSVTSCCSAANNVVCNDVQTCCSVGGDAVCCSHGDICAGNAAVCYPNTTTAAPAPTGPACMGLGSYCMVGQQCCTNVGCYDPTESQCCASNFICRASQQCCFNSTGQGSCCDQGQLCDSAQGWCVAPTPAPPTVTCAGSVCITGELCCGNSQCYDPSLSECCVGPAPTVCLFASQVVCCPYGTGYCCGNGTVCSPSADACVVPTPAPTNLICGGVACASGYLCCGTANSGQCYPENVDDVCCGSSVTGYTVCTVGQICQSASGQCVVVTPVPAIPQCGGSNCPAPYLCCGSSASGACFNPGASYCCQSTNYPFQVCTIGQTCDPTNGCVTTAAPTVPQCGFQPCAPPSQCCGIPNDGYNGQCYNSSMAFCCQTSSGAAQVCTLQQTCDPSNGCMWPQCGGSNCISPNQCCGTAMSGQCYAPADAAYCCFNAWCPPPSVCDTSSMTCNAPTTAAPVGPACGGTYCPTTQQCCGNATTGECYTAASSECCWNGFNWPSICGAGQVCNPQTSQCFVPTPAPPTGPACGGTYCPTTQQCCGNATNGECYSSTATCCWNGNGWPSICGAGQVCNTQSGQCFVPTPSPPVGPACGGTYCPTTQQCCGNATTGECYSSTATCCWNGYNWPSICSAGEVCNTQSGQCFAPTPAPPGIPCGQGNCTGSQNACCGYPGNGVCFDTNSQICCQAGLNFVCPNSLSCCVSRNGLVNNCCASGTCNQQDGTCSLH